MREYSYNGYAEKTKTNINAIRLIFLIIVIISAVIGMVVGYPEVIFIVVLYPAINWIFGEKSIPCKISVQIDEVMLRITYHSVTRNKNSQDEIYEFGPRDIKKIYWLQKNKKIGVCGYPKIKYCQNGQVVQVFDCRKNRKRQRIYINYFYDYMCIKSGNNSKLVKK